MAKAGLGGCGGASLGMIENSNIYGELYTIAETSTTSYLAEITMVGL